jgi:hypothetical protein
MLVANLWWQVFLAGAAGPFLVEIGKLATARNHKRALQRLTEPSYWAVTIALLLLGGFVALMYGIDPQGVPVLRAAHLGAAAPLLVSAWASAAPQDVQRKGLVPHPKGVGEPRSDIPRPSLAGRLMDNLRWESKL